MESLISRTQSGDDSVAYDLQSARAVIEDLDRQISAAQVAAAGAAGADARRVFAYQRSRGY